MPQQRLSNTEFLASLTSLLASQSASSHGSIFVTQKSLPSSADAPSPSTQTLIRATNGATVNKPSTKSKVPANKITRVHNTSVERVKIATVVDEKDLDEFWVRYAETCKKGMEGLRKRDKKKAKARAQAKKKAKGPGAAATATAAS